MEITTPNTQKFPHKAKYNFDYFLIKREINIERILSSIQSIEIDPITKNNQEKSLEEHELENEGINMTIESNKGDNKGMNLKEYPRIELVKQISCGEHYTISLIFTTTNELIVNVFKKRYLNTNYLLPWFPANPIADIISDYVNVYILTKYGILCSVPILLFREFDSTKWSHIWNEFVNNDHPELFLQTYRNNKNREENESSNSSLFSCVTRNLPSEFCLGGSPKRSKHSMNSFDISEIRYLKLSSYKDSLYICIKWWVDFSKQKMSEYLIIVNSEGVIMILNVDNLERIKSFHLNQRIERCLMIEASFMKEAYLLLRLEGNNWYKQKIMEKDNTASNINISSIISSSPISFDPVLIHYFQKYDMIKCQLLKVDVYSVIGCAFGIALLDIYDAQHIQQPIYSINLNKFIPKSPTITGFAIVTKCLILSTNQIYVFSLDLLQGLQCSETRKYTNISKYSKPIFPLNSRGDLESYYDSWFYKNYSNLHPVYQVIDISPNSRILGLFSEVETDLYKTGNKKLEKFSESEYFRRVGIECVSDKEYSIIQMNHLGANSLFEALISIQTSFDLRRLEIYLDYFSWVLLDFYPKLSKDLRTPSFQHPLVENLTIITKLKLSLRYAILSDIDYKQIFQLYSPQLELIPDLCNWYLQLLILEKYKFDQEKSTEIFVMMIFLILKYMRSNLDSALLKYDIVESIIRKEQISQECISIRSATSEEVDLPLKYFCDLNIDQEIRNFFIDILVTLTNNELIKYIKSLEASSYLNAYYQIFEISKNLTNFSDPLKEMSKQTEKMDYLVEIQNEIMNLHCSQSLRKYTPILTDNQITNLLLIRIYSNIEDLAPQHQIFLRIFRGLLLTKNSLPLNNFIQNISSFIEMCDKCSAEELKVIILDSLVNKTIFQIENPFLQRKYFEEFLLKYISILEYNGSKLFNFSLLKGTNKAPREEKMNKKLKKRKQMISIYTQTFIMKNKAYYSSFIQEFTIVLIIYIGKIELNNIIAETNYIDKVLNELLLELINKFPIFLDLKITEQLLMKYNMQEGLERFWLVKEALESILHYKILKLGLDKTGVLNNSFHILQSIHQPTQNKFTNYCQSMLQMWAFYEVKAIDVENILFTEEYVLNIKKPILRLLFDQLYMNLNQKTKFLTKEGLSKLSTYLN